jgi:hypothetical protein
MQSGWLASVKPGDDETRGQSLSLSALASSSEPGLFSSPSFSGTSGSLGICGRGFVVRREFRGQGVSWTEFRGQVSWTKLWTKFRGQKFRESFVDKVSWTKFREVSWTKFRGQTEKFREGKFRGQKFREKFRGQTEVSWTDGTLTLWGKMSAKVRM